VKIFDVLKSEKPIFILDDIEDKKTKALIPQINSQLSTILSKLDTFNEFAKSQLEGDYNNKIVMAKSLQRVYSNWSAINNVCAGMVREEANAINEFNSAKNQLISNLQILLKDVQKLPVVSAYDVFGDDFAMAKKDHNVVILGNNNIAVIETIINELNKNLYVEGNYNRIEAKELSANYSVVEKNVKECKSGIDAYFYGKTSKEEKLLAIVETMEKAAVDLVFFATYKNDLKAVGCSDKEIDLYEKELLKKYVPLKKQLSKVLKVDFADVCDIPHDETEFATKEFRTIDEDFFS
jgi:hypothetical protein